MRMSPVNRKLKEIALQLSIVVIECCQPFTPDSRYHSTGSLVKGPGPRAALLKNSTRKAYLRLVECGGAASFHSTNSYAAPKLCGVFGSRRCYSLLLFILFCKVNASPWRAIPLTVNGRVCNQGIECQIDIVFALDNEVIQSFAPSWGFATK